MNALPAPLEQLKASYLQLLNQVDAGTLDPDDALAQLSNLSATDTVGSRWTVHDQSEPEHIMFLRSFDGKAAQQALPAQWDNDPRPKIRIPDDPAPSDTWTWADDSTADEPADSGPWDTGGWDDSEDLFAPPDVPPADQAATRQAPARTPKLPRREKLSTDRDRRRPLALRNVWDANRTTIIVTVVGIFALVALVTYSRSGSGDTAAPATVTTAPAAQTCPDITSQVSGLNEKGLRLLGCVGDPADPESLARFVLVEDPAGWRFDPATPITREVLAATVGQMYNSRTGLSPSALRETPHPTLSGYVSLALEHGLIADGPMGDPITVAEAAVAYVTTINRIAGDTATPDADAALTRLRTLDVLENSGPSDALTAASWLTATTAVLFNLPDAPAATSTSGPFPDSAPSATTAAPVAPANERVVTVLSALTSADANLVRTVLPSYTDSADDALELALYAGMAPTGIDIVPQAAPQMNGPDTAVSRVTLTRAGVEIRQMQLSWKNLDGAWVLSSWPTTL